MRGVFAELFDPAGSSVELRTANRYSDGPTTFGAIVAGARGWGEVAIGYRLASGSVTINPPKSASVALAKGDQVIVLVPGTASGKSSPASSS